MSNSLVSAPSNIIIIQHQHSSLEDAVQEVKEGTAWVAIEIRKNFTVDFVLRGLSTLNGSEPSQAIINGSTIYLYMDVTSETMLKEIRY